jgi:nicotinamidase-related amidase
MLGLGIIFGFFLHRRQARLAALEATRLQQARIRSGRGPVIPATQNIDGASWQSPGRTLVVVDIQSYFVKDVHRQFIEGVESLVRSAIALGWSIILLEFRPTETYGATWQRIIDLLKGYDRWDTAYKGQPDGSTEVQQLCHKNQYTIEGFVVCGVYTDQCVLETVTGLASKYPRSAVEVVPAASMSYPETQSTGRYDWKRFPKAANISLIAVPTEQCVEDHSLSHSEPAAAMQEMLVTRSKPSLAAAI